MTRNLGKCAICTPLVFALLNGGCDSATASIEKEKELRQRIEIQQKELESLRTEFAKYKEDQSFNESARDWDRIAYLTPSSRGYSMIKTDFGVITVSLEDVNPYANGSRITLRFGNVTSATLTDVKATVEWGEVDAKGTPMNDEAKTREITFERSFRPGAWTNVAVVLEGTPPARLGFVRLRNLSNKGIELYR